MPKTRILFVDDEHNVIEGLRRILRKQRGWDMSFVLSGYEALAKMAESPFDVIVTDMKMPGMSGAELLKHALMQYPNTARIVLSGHADESSSHQAVTLAHQFLSKPADAETIKQAVSRACAMQQLACNKRIRRLVGSCRTLPSLPDLYIELTEAAKSDDADARTIGDIISRDVAMSAKILQLVNSSFFGIGRRVSSVDLTVALLGVIRIKALVLSEHVFREFKPPRSIPGFSIVGLWRHSMAVAEFARLISKREHQTDDRPDQAFTAGLLHDVGILMLASQHPDGFEEMLLRSQQSEAPSPVIEEELFGATHGEIGAYLLDLWALPPRISEAVAFHHHPCTSPYNGLCAVTAVHAADALISRAGEDESKLHGYPITAVLDETYLERLGLADRQSRWGAFLTEVCEKQMVEQV